MRTDLWSEEEEKFLIENYGKMPLAELAKMLSRSSAAVKTKMSRLEVRPTVAYKWKPEEVAFLENNADKMMAKEIAAHLGRTTNSVLAKGAHIGINFTRTRKFYSDEDVALCRALHRERVPLKVIATKMEVPFNTLKSFLYKSHRGFRDIKPAQ